VRLEARKSARKTGIEPPAHVDTISDSAEKPYECFDYAQHERKTSKDFTRSSVRPEVLEG